MKKNIIIIILLGITVAFGILLGKLTLTSRTKCQTTKKIVTKKEEKKYDGFYKGTIQNINDPEKPHEIYVALYDNNSAVISYISDQVNEYIGGYKIEGNDIIITTQFARSSGRFEDTHKLTVGNKGSLIYKTDETESYKTEFNELIFTEITKEEYDNSLSQKLPPEDYSDC